MSPVKKSKWDWLIQLLQIAVEWLRKCIPSYNPSKWNDDDFIQYNNNCYNYGCDIITNTYAQPGKAHGINLSQDDCHCQIVKSAAEADGLVSISNNESCGCKECQHQVALVISPDWDYHWYRKDLDGKWSHKMGWTEATNLDNNNNIIDDPRTCARGSYTDFCGFFCVNKQNVQIT